MVHTLALVFHICVCQLYWAHFLQMAKSAYTQQQSCQGLATPVGSQTNKQADEGQEIADDVTCCICLGEEL